MTAYKSNNRIEWVDTLKFLGIFAIYIGHLGDLSGKSYPFVFLYHVQIFFFAAGFFASYRPELTFFSFIKSRFMRLMVPYFAFGFTTVTFRAVMDGYGVVQYLSAFSSILYGVRNDEFVGGTWFVNCLFFISVIDYVAFRLLRNSYLVLLASLLVFLATQYILPCNPLGEPCWFMNTDSALAYWWLMAAGRIIFPFINKALNSDRNWMLWLPFAGLSLIAAYTYFNTGHFYFWLMQHAMPSVALEKPFWVINYLIEPLSLVLFNVGAAVLLSRSDIMNTLGRNSLNLCGLETVMKLFIPVAIACIGLRIEISSEIQALFYCLICLAASHFVSGYLAKAFPGIFGIK
ncbi:acyltransferase family protein [Pantoea ananatis]|uniref:acyltransferase family protein n=1 Tax=Pantoea ananas TaxID=553 RepID=UPI0002323307|nr:acyltransferase family protein [Pantoea ananatis]AER33584.1 acyltransferase family protein [Pantoea ananatis PA13]